MNKLGLNEISIRDSLWKKAIQSTITNKMSIEDSTRYEYVIDGDRPFGRTSKYSKVSLNGSIVCIAKFDESTKRLSPHSLLKNDIIVINRKLNRTKIRITKEHQDIELEYLKVREGDEIEKGDIIAYNSNPRYVKQSKLSGKVVAIRSCDKNMNVVVETEYSIDQDGIKLIAIGDQKGTTRVFENRFKALPIDKNHPFVKELESKGFIVNANSSKLVSNPKFVSDLVSAFKRKNWSFIAHISLGSVFVTREDFDEAEEWNRHKFVNVCRVIDQHTNEEYVGIYGFVSWLIGRQVPDYELKFAKKIDPYIGESNGTSVDIFSRYIIRHKYGEEVEKKCSNENKNIIDWDSILEEFEEIE